MTSRESTDSTPREFTQVEIEAAYEPVFEHVDPHGLCCPECKAKPTFTPEEATELIFAAGNEKRSLNPMALATAYEKLLRMVR